jgi:hypothetical protein
MAYSLRGQFIESCSCNMLCPCWFGVPSLAIQDQGWCATAAAVRIQAGNSDGVDLSGRTVALALDFPDVIFNGNGTGRLYLEEGCSAEQQRELEAIFQGKKGGPMGAIGPLLSTWLPTQTAAISVDDTGDTIAVRVGNAGEVRSQLLRDGEGQSFTLQGGGFVSGLRMDAGELAPSASRWSDPDMPRQFETKSGIRGAITWNA